MYNLAALSPRQRLAREIPGAAGVLAVIGLFGWGNYLAFHGLAEMFSIAIAAAAFLVAWNSRDYPHARPLLRLALGLGFVALIDFFHLLTYSGMGVFVPPRDYATKLWVAGRGLQAAVFAFFALSLGSGRELRPQPYLAVLAAVTGLLIGSILYGSWFPDCFVEGSGLTPFKVTSEYVVSAAFAGSAFLMHRRRGFLHGSVYQALSWSLALTIASELTFTLYATVTGIANLIGHLLKIAAYYFAYLALVAEQVRRRIELIRQLEDTRASLQARERDLEEANEAKDRFYTVIAHDMRNAIGGLKTTADLLALHDGTLGDADRRMLVGILREGSQQALGLLERLLLWGRSRTGRLEISPRAVVLRDLVEDILEEVSVDAGRKQVSVSSNVPSGVVVHADPEIVGTILRNLLNNAVKFTPPGGKVVVKSCEQQGRIAVSVADTGVGMAPAALRELLRGGSPGTTLGTASEPGTGLGLLVCREFAEKSGGAITGETAPGQGTTFTFTLPREAEARAG
jgi:signal transduction histidine kinase